MGIVGIEFSVARDEQAEAAVVIIVSPTRSRRPSTQRHASFFRDVGEGAIVIVVIEAVLAEVGDVNVRPAIVIVVTNGNAESPALVRDSRFVSHIGKGAVVIVVE